MAIFTDLMESAEFSADIPPLTTMKLVCVSRVLHPRRPFRISRGSRAEVRNVFVCVEKDGVKGYGEASPINYYQETWQSVMEKLESARRFLANLELRSVADLEAAWAAMWAIVSPSRAAQCALDTALWDWLARRRDVSVSELAWGFKPHPVISFCTIGLSDPEELVAKVDELRGFPRIKIKSSYDASLNAVHHAREHTQAILAVDANGAWEGVDLMEISGHLAASGVAFVEQPLPSAHDSGLSRSSAGLPLMADESCVLEEDVDQIASRYAACNIKLVKCGGITPARRMAQRCEALELRAMVGCMLESSALIAAGAAIAQKTEFADLDGAWLLGDDPFDGWTFDRGTLWPPDEPGLGVTPHAGLFES